MARYIDKEIVCEAYVHLDVDETFTPEKIKHIERELKRFFDARVSFLLGATVQTEIETAPGSLKVKLTAYAGIAALLGGAVSAYPSFRDGVKAMYEDSRMLAEATNLETVFVTRTPSCDRLHAEARTGVVGRLAKLVTTIDTLEGEASNMLAPVKKSEIGKIATLSAAIVRLDQDARSILSKIKTDEDRYCIAQGLHAAFGKLPEVLPAEKELAKNPLKKEILREENLDALADAEFRRYTAAVRSAKEMLRLVGVSSKPQRT